MASAERRPCPRRRPCGVVVICTKDRAEEVETACSAVHDASPSMPILVMDASTTEATRHICERIAYQPSVRLIYRRARQSGLARQRNEAVGVCRELGVEVVHFIDDDTEVSAGYFDAIEGRFREDSTVMGVGGIILNQPPADHLMIKSFFLLRSHRRGSVLPSGRAMMGQYPGSRAGDSVDWLSGCSMSYRIGVFADVLFDSRLEGYSLGEDYDFGFRLSRIHRLVVEPGATCVHHVTQVSRNSVRAVAQEGTVTVHRWVEENRELGMSRPAFWWATLGEVMLHTASWLLRGDHDALQETRGVLDGVFDIVRNLSSTGGRTVLSTLEGGQCED